MRRSPLRTAGHIDAPLSIARNSSCPRDIGCGCRSNTNRSGHMNRASTPVLVHTDGCEDPDCHEMEQLKALQKSLDHFTDYEHYEKCCDGRHHGKRSKEECCMDIDIKQFTPSIPCLDYLDDCDECADQHKDCYDEVEVCDDDCEQCEVECEERGHEPEDCPHDHPTTRDNCTDSCEPFCKLEHAPLPQLGPTNDFDSHAVSTTIQDTTSCTNDCSIPMQHSILAARDPLAGMVFNNDMDHWQTFVQTHHCAPDPCVIGQPPQFQHPQHMDPSFGFTFGCDPTIPANQYPWQKQIPPCNIPLNIHIDLPSTATFPTRPSSKSAMPKQPTPSQSPDSASSPVDVSIPASRTCEWVMPCGSICGATFPRTDDLKKHIKNSHSTKGTKTCHWKSCSSSFASEAALTGHISKKHLTVFSDEEGPWKCTFPSCTKTFMYKQVRDDHLASHNGGNRMHCPICHQWLNCEGSNFRRHMASHGPKNEYMRCRFEAVGCKKRFPRLDNLRRHEGCCKFGKRAAGVHHHHHTVHVGHEA